jgi:hypothetical protein
MHFFIKLYLTYLAYLAGLHFIRVTGLFHADWLGVGEQRLLLAHS